MKKWICFIFLLVPFLGFTQDQILHLRENLKKASAGDYIVTQQGKNYTTLIVKENTPETITIQEVTTPVCQQSWSEWVKQNAPGNTSWVSYTIEIPTGKMIKYYSFTKKGWYQIAEANNFLSKLLNLELHLVPLKERKKVGNRYNCYWNPTLVVEGKNVPGIFFHAYRTYWPKDGSELSDKTIVIYIPENQDTYPSYFPYWLQISGIVGKANVRIIDSGKNLTSPMRIN